MREIVWNFSKKINFNKNLPISYKNIKNSPSGFKLLDHGFWPCRTFGVTESGPVDLEGCEAASIKENRISKNFLAGFMVEKSRGHSQIGSESKMHS